MKVGKSSTRTEFLLFQVFSNSPSSSFIAAFTPSSHNRRHHPLKALNDELTLGPSGTDHHQIKTAKELLRLGGSCKDEEDCYIDVFDEGEYHNPGSRISGGQDLLRELDDLEAARPKPGKRRVIVPGNREGIWETPYFGAVKSDFDSWVDEVAALEASASMPKGTRYYKVKDPGDSTI
ncbi:hypothetical protein F5B21DRAFT_507851 [Xylaria acuta]|nr:hypothetical protein F5B21DRAFT_507851 [Xylaria acuta]